MKNLNSQKTTSKSSPREFRFEAMGGEFQLFTYSNKLSQEQFEKIGKLAEEEVSRIENKFTEFKPSKLNIINEMAGVQPVPVDEETFALIEKSIEYSNFTKGHFDITFASVGHLWRKAKEDNRKLGMMERLVASRFIDYRKIELNRHDQTVYLPHKKIKISLGGMGKGYAVDSVYELLLEFGFENFYVNGAGDIRVHSREDAPRKWRFGIQNPLANDFDKKIGVIQITQGSISSSGGYVERNKMEGGSADHHIIQTKNGFSNSKVIASTVYANNATASDIYATTLMNMTPMEGLKFLDHNDIAGMIVCSEGKSWLSKKALKNFGI
jgi:thiamine biosynthesis lipoprotein